jgi:hypothetical protein
MGEKRTTSSKIINFSKFIFELMGTPSSPHGGTNYILFRFQCFLLFFHPVTEIYLIQVILPILRPLSITRVLDLIQWRDQLSTLPAGWILRILISLCRKETLPSPLDPLLRGAVSLYDSFLDSAVIHLREGLSFASLDQPRATDFSTTYFSLLLCVLLISWVLKITVYWLFLSSATSDLCYLGRQIVLLYLMALLSSPGSKILSFAQPKQFKILTYKEARIQEVSGSNISRDSAMELAPRSHFSYSCLFNHLW